MVFEEGSKFRAESLRHAAYALMTPLAAICMNLILTGFDDKDTLIVSLPLALILGYCGFWLLDFSIGIMYKRDDEYEHKYKP
jgi:cyanate permease